MLITSGRPVIALKEARFYLELRWHRANNVLIIKDVFLFFENILGGKENARFKICP